MGSLPASTTPRENESSCFSDHQLTITPLPREGPWGLLLQLGWDFSQLGFLLVPELMCAKAMACLRSSVYSFLLIYQLLHFPAPSSSVFPESWLPFSDFCLCCVSFFQTQIKTSQPSDHVSQFYVCHMKLCPVCAFCLWGLFWRPLINMYPQAVMNNKKSNNNTTKERLTQLANLEVLLDHLVLSLRHQLRNLAGTRAKGHYGKAGINSHTQIYVLRYLGF